MKAYFCVNEQSLPVYARHLRVAVLSAINIAGLKPQILFDGDQDTLLKALGVSGANVIKCHSSILDYIRATNNTRYWSQQAAEGALLRLEIPLIEENDEFVLYADCDVIFTGEVDLTRIYPQWIAAAPGGNPNNWFDICSGVMLLNVKNMRKEHPSYMDVAKKNLGKDHFYDQEVLNLHFRGRIDRLPISYHWKAYWPPNPHARIVHFHGPKRHQIETILNNFQKLEPAYQALFMQEDGLKFYSKLFDAIEDKSVVDLSTLRSFSRQERQTFRTKRLIGRIRRYLPSSKASDDFDEDYYLYANPDVAIALYNNWIPSGWWHYVSFGRSEGRLGSQPE